MPANPHQHYANPHDVPIDILQPLVLDIGESRGVKGRDSFCCERGCLADLIQALGPGAGHFNADALAKVLINHAKQGRLRFKSSSNRGARSYESRESEDSSAVYERLKEPDWIHLSEACKRRAEYRCQMCNAPSSKGLPLESHHRTYKRMRTPDEANDLIALCRKCHTSFHDIVRTMPNDLF